MKEGLRDEHSKNALNEDGLLLGLLKADQHSGNGGSGVHSSGVIVPPQPRLQFSRSDDDDAPDGYMLSNFPCTVGDRSGRFDTDS